MNYIRLCARRMSSEELIDEVVRYNHRTIPIEGDLVEVAVDVGSPKFLNHLLDNMGEELMQKHMLTAVHSRKVKMVKCLKMRGLSVNGYYLRRVSYLGYSSSRGAVPMTRCLLKLGADVDAKDTSGCTPLLNCAKMAPLKFLIPTMKLLLEHGADERVCDENEDDIDTCLLKRKLDLKADEFLANVHNWRAWKNFKEVCVSFNTKSVEEFTKKKKKKKKKKAVQKRKHKKRKLSSVGVSFLELHPDILSEVFSFFDKV